MSVDLTGFSLQNEADKEDDQIIIKITGSVALFLVEYDPSRRKRHLRKENGKHAIHAVCNKIIYGTLNAALMACKKLTKQFREWGMVTNPYDPCV